MENSFFENIAFAKDIIYKNSKKNDGIFFIAQGLMAEEKS